MTFVSRIYYLMLMNIGTVAWRQRFPFFPDLNLLDWSSHNVLAVGLHNSVHLWDASGGGVICSLKQERNEGHVCSLAWSKEGSYLAVGTSGCSVQVGFGRMWRLVKRPLYISTPLPLPSVVGCRKPETAVEHGGPRRQSRQPELERPHPVQVRFLRLIINGRIPGPMGLAWRVSALPVAPGQETFTTMT